MLIESPYNTVLYSDFLNALGCIEADKNWNIWISNHGNYGLQLYVHVRFTVCWCFWFTFVAFQKWLIKSFQLKEIQLTKDIHKAENELTGLPEGMPGFQTPCREMLELASNILDSVVNIFKLLVHTGVILFEIYMNTTNLLHILIKSSLQSLAGGFCQYLLS